MIAEAGVATDEQARAAARLRGAAEALSVLRERAPAEHQRACRFATNLLAAKVPTADWTSAGLPPPVEPARRSEQPVPPDHHAVLHLARAAMALYCAELHAADRPAHWRWLADFFARYLLPSDPELVRLRERAVSARVDAGDTAPEVFGELFSALGFHLATHGADAYLTALARSNLLAALAQRDAEGDLAEATVLAKEEVASRTIRYGPEHAVTLAARSQLIACLLIQAEASDDDAGQRRLAHEAFVEIGCVREAYDRLSGTASADAIASRRYEARALLLLGEREKAKEYLRYALALESTRGGQQGAR